MREKNELQNLKDSIYRCTIIHMKCHILFWVFLQSTIYFTHPYLAEYTSINEENVTEQNCSDITLVPVHLHTFFIFFIFALSCSPDGRLDTTVNISVRCSDPNIVCQTRALVREHYCHTLGNTTVITRCIYRLFWNSSCFSPNRLVFVVCLTH